jgi:transcriptional regulator with XRE-family HTH domain
MFDPALNDKVAARIKRLRRKHSYTQEALAEMANLSSQHIQRLEGKKPSGCSIATIQSIAKAFGITLCQFFEEL